MTHAPSMSAYNHVERRMAPLSKALTTLVLPHDTCGSRLDSQHRTIDEELEKKNFKVAGEILAQVWSELVLDEHPIVAEFVQNESMASSGFDEHWVFRHCRLSHYMLQIVKCDDTDCCTGIGIVGKNHSIWLSTATSAYQHRERIECPYETKH